MPQRIAAVSPGSLAARSGIKAGETLISINRTPVLDLVDYQFLTARPSLELLLEDDTGAQHTVHIHKHTEDALGLTLESSLMSCPKTCANHCMFCFIEQMPPGMRPSLYVRDDDWRLSLMAGNFVTLTNLPKAEMDRMIERKASPIYISVQTTNGELRKKMLSHIHADRIMEHLHRFADNDMSFHCQVVLCPEINDGPELTRTLTDLASLAPHALTVALVPVGLTKFREHLYPLRPYTREEALAVVREAERFQQEMLAKHGTRFVFPSDEFYQIAGLPIPEPDTYEDFPQFENGVGLLSRLRDEFREAARLAERFDPNGEEIVPRRVVMATGVSVAPFMQSLLDEHPIPGVQIAIHPIINRFFGETVTVSGLITGQDLVAQLQGVEADEILITESMLREGEDIFLDDMTLTQAQEALGIRIHPVPDDGADLLDALRGTEEYTHG
ncbi:MAG: DUF512 domain-containing protein [Christensenellales bacterium]|nr:DUF512 domain-containing protein [Christensenellales bacterium]